MLIQEEKLKYWIENFYGYGSWSAPIWFIAFEEGGGDTPEDVADRINYFQHNHAVAEPSLCDIREMYKSIRLQIDGPKANLFRDRYDYRFGENAIQHGLWKNLIAFAHGFSGESVPDLLSYQQEHFALPTSKEALINLYPLPSPHNHAWYYSWLDLPELSFIKSREVYQQTIFKKRIETILTNINHYKPRIVVMYGMQNINLLKEAIVGRFTNATFRLVKAQPRVVPQHHITSINNCSLVITSQVPALKHGRIETGFDWNFFGEKMRTSI